MTSFAKSPTWQGPMSGLKQSVGVKQGQGLAEASREVLNGTLNIEDPMARFNQAVTGGIELHLWP